MRYADDIVLLAKSERAAKRLLESSTNFLEKKLKLTVNREKSRVVSIYSIRNFKFLGFALGRNTSGTFIRVHPKSWKKMKSKLKDLTSRRPVQSLKPAPERIRVYIIQESLIYEKVGLSKVSNCKAYSRYMLPFVRDWAGVEGKKSVDVKGIFPTCEKWLKIQHQRKCSC